MYSFDSDSFWAPVADTVNKYFILQDWRFKASTCMSHKLDYPFIQTETLRFSGETCRLGIKADMVIASNLADIYGFDWWFMLQRKGSLVVLQGNNLPSKRGGVFAASMDEFVKKTPLETVIFEKAHSFTNYESYIRVGLI